MSLQSIKKYLFLFCFVIAVSLFSCVINNSAVAADVGVADFSWLPNTETDLAGYKIHYGINQGGPYGLVVDLGIPAPVDGRIHGSVTGLTAGVTYFFVGTAYNNADLESDFSVEVEYSAPLPPPVDVTSPIGNVVIASGVTGTESGSVILTLSASDAGSGVAQMQFSNNNVDWSAPEAYAVSKSWGLSDGLGLKTVYVKFQDGAGNWSPSYSDSIESYENSGETVLSVFGSAGDTSFPGTIEDTYLNLNDENNQASFSLNTYTWPTDSVANAIVLKIDLSGLPVGAVIESAVLSLYMNGAGGDALYDVAVHKIIHHNPQLELCTGHVYDGTNGWTPNNSCYNSVPLAQADLAVAEDSLSLENTYGYKSWNVTTMVNDWMTIPETNFGLLLNSDAVAGSDSYRNFASSEALDPGQRPRLVITYSLVARPAAPGGFIVFD
ncbi:MAG: DNRLRE domain-containing protein [Deltaproteobacteria bacterium]|nr:DNRLRE domain-containing protein [Candidatus Tharpella aukensis]